MSDRPTMSMCLHGESGVGKSWLASTALKPLLIGDVEGRAKHVPGRKIWWDPISQAPPAPPENGEWEICIVNVTSFSVLARIYEWLRSGQHPFRAFSLDSLMETQKRWMDDEVGSGQMKTQDWGAVLRALEKLVRDLRDLVNYDIAHIDQVVVVTGSVPDERNVARPLLQGQLKNTLPYFVDVCAWYSVQPNPHDPNSFLRVLNVGPTPYAVAKDGTGRLGGPMIVDPNLTDMYNKLITSEVTA